MERKSLLLTDFNQVVSAQGTTPLSGKQARNLQVIKKGAIYCEGETVIAVGPSDVLKKEYSANKTCLIAFKEGMNCEKKNCLAVGELSDTDSSIIDSLSSTYRTNHTNHTNHTNYTN